MDLTADHVLAHRAAVQGLGGGDLGGGDLGVLALGVVDSPPKTGAAAVAVRDLRFTGPLVRVLGLRGAPHLHRPDDLPALRRRLRPRTSARLASWCGAFPVPALEHVDLVVAAMLREFPGERATKAELSAAITPGLPADVRPLCPPCGTEHVIEGLFRLCTLLAGLELEPTGPKLVFGRPIPGSAGSACPDPAARTAPAPDGASGPGPVVPAVVPAVPTSSGAAGGAEVDGAVALVREYARFVGPFAKADAERWLGAKPDQWPATRPVRVDGRRLLLLADESDPDEPDPDGPDPADAPEVPAGLLLFPRDPYLLGPRWLVAEPEVAKRVWRPVGSPGALVVHGRVAGAWRYDVSGRTMTFHVERWSAVKGSARRAVRDQADVLAGVWGSTALEAHVVEW
ncbi:crosslink repair DNA glycosylase YcaQ family protein [Actinosynnema sp. NPDC047251]|uniref:Winged helix DNA-binding domain-containing protein n=1 Tax=Saccharothrix espanaensis (strain ATCC 51144 / DSM 44229 / JCM 9112 / NBRC 15066 / NRRL 15764) TaxID=1179773 RepID=K0K9V0_SACES|nr:crosslink repair DNA glycosylase YcaQ family protein [Saccharothrix espanaensis]CCH33574.1 hypothetical protein BN6_63300 [Saccharothrix espanaensis DSM 44229]